ncbi:MAG: IPT/TIG domain-containing protein [Acidobacteria bacterium]|nr:IPT/TIG domain-containing protein [Acidobacteriota bacterium]MBV9478871.1 IPT/TIG domain-containing protein [Acidobacteriota bacterium]
MPKLRALAVLAALVLSLTAAASPVITSISPTSGPPEGGTAVTIHGTGFSNSCIICTPPFAAPTVYFGGEVAQSVEFVDSTTVIAVTPPHLPGTVSVSLSQIDGSDPNDSVLENAFTYTGTFEDAFDPILFPIYAEPTHGRFGSEFVTIVRVAAKDTPVRLWGYDTSCTLFDPPIYPDMAMTIGPEIRLVPNCTESVGRLFYVEKGRSGDLAANLRVQDVSRDALDQGTEIPVVHRSQFDDERIVLLGVPIDTRFRNTLRIYGLSNEFDHVNVTVNNEIFQVPLQPATDRYTPAYGVFEDFPLPAALPSGQNTVSVKVEVPRLGAGQPSMPIWAFVSVTNNETQHITTITPN